LFSKKQFLHETETSDLLSTISNISTNSQLFHSLGLLKGEAQYKQALYIHLLLQQFASVYWLDRVNETSIYGLT